ncbi:MAG: VOC family protein [Pseudomonadota bacterium]
MIIPNLMVTDMSKSIAFYRDGLGMKLKMTVKADRSFGLAAEADPEGAVFAVLDWNGAEIMLQTNESLSEELEIFSPAQKPSPAGTVYFRGFDGRTVINNLSSASIIKGPGLAWYGMLELYVRDPDGHVICLACPDGPTPV